MQEQTRSRISIIYVSLSGLAVMITAHQIDRGSFSTCIWWSSRIWDIESCDAMDGWSSSLILHSRKSMPCKILLCMHGLPLELGVSEATEQYWEILKFPITSLSLLDNLRMISKKFKLQRQWIKIYKIFFVKKRNDLWNKGKIVKIFYSIYFYMYFK
jgi:hypothetical protein